jgi:hypothetical protein
LARLVLLGGPPGVGKTTALKALEDRIPGMALLDADDVWRVSSGLAIPPERQAAIVHVVSVMRGHFEAGCDIGLLSWVFARSELYQPVIDAMEDLVDAVQMLYLIAQPETIAARLTKRREPGKIEYAMSRLALIESLPFQMLDTTDLTPTQVADWLQGAVTR